MRNEVTNLVRHSTNTKVYKFTNFAGLYFPYFAPFRTQTLHFTNFGMSFHAIVMNCAITLSIMHAIETMPSTAGRCIKQVLL